MDITTNAGKVLNYTKALEKKIKKSSELAQKSLQEEAKRTTNEFLTAPNTLSDRFAIVNVVRFGDAIKFRATGTDVMFIEFGTGIAYPDNHPLAREVGAIRGAYGAGHGSEIQWSFWAEQGKEGPMSMEIDPENNSGLSFYITSGQPAEMPMYHASLRIPDKIKAEIKKIF